MSGYDQGPPPRQRDRYNDSRPAYDDNYGPPPSGRDRYERSPRGPPQAPVRRYSSSHSPRGRREREYPPPPLDARYGTAGSRGEAEDPKPGPSILVDPNETPAQRQRRRSSRSRSNVRLQVGGGPSSDDDNYGRRGGGPPRRPAMGGRRKSVDLEQKNADADRRFRSRRDDYESDEGETLRKGGPPDGRRGEERRPRRRDYDDRGYDNYDDTRPPPERRKSFSDRFKDKLNISSPTSSSSSRPKPGRDHHDSAVEYGTGPLAAAAAAAGVAAVTSIAKKHGHGRGEHDYGGEPAGRSRRHDPYHEDDHLSAPRRNSHSHEDRYAHRRPSPRDRDRYAEDRYGGRDAYADRDSRDRRSRPPPADEQYYSDSRDNRRPRRDDRRERERDSRRGATAGDRRSGTRKDGRGGSKLGGALGGAGRGGGEWQKEVGAAFMTYAMPYIKKEGGKIVKRELQNFLEKRGGAH